jgi:RNA polymerase sigma factor (TIGR02999 family)
MTGWAPFSRLDDLGPSARVRGAPEERVVDIPVATGVDTDVFNDTNRIFIAIGQGDPRAAGRLWPRVYAELRRLAAAQIARERRGLTLDATALVHEAFLRLGVDSDHTFANRRHFFAAAAEAMRHILVEHARRRGRKKRGGGRRQEFPDLDALLADTRPEELLALHDALERFATADPLKAKLVELRFFAGLTLSQAAECLDISPSTADRGWRYARAWLYEAMAGEDDPGRGEKKPAYS